MMREGERAGVRFSLATADSAAAVFEDMAILHQSRWTARGKSGAFAAPRFREFHRSLLAAWIGDGRAILARLSLNSETLAVLYGFVRGPVFSFYQGGVRIEDAVPLHSPGNLAHLLLMEHLAGRGVRTYDFLRGSAAYKERLARGANTVMSLQCWRKSSRARARRAMMVLGLVAHRGWRALRRKRP
jgi:CelD/BcsL family acetyltransferase involved in cellulose biosynthesis